MKSTKGIFSAAVIDAIELILQNPIDFQEPITSDASDRSYWRLGNRQRTLIVQKRRSAFDQNTDRYIRSTQFFKKHGLPVPEIYLIGEKEGVVIMEDCGHLCLQQLLTRTNKETLQRLYGRALEILWEHGRISTPAYEEDVRQGQVVRLNRHYLYWELMFFFRRFCMRVVPRRLSVASEVKLLDQLDRLALLVSECSRRFAHRDYHSRNLIVNGDRLSVVDFQDALEAPWCYDYASLLFDPYVVLPPPMTELFEASLVDHAPPGMSADEIRRQVALVASQRLLKAVGTYSWQVVGERNLDFQPYLRPAYLRALACLESVVETRDLATNLRRLWSPG